ncbi:phospholipase [Rhodobacteraceae bacterium N5(2021)]|uniref:Phospholipase D n=1 Tax=Gymnodinialimonas phycosphaerae TaxID=2841589 RepID=A0A975YHN3_9RHOB|nr:phospholipase D-like domain-containing protein [Gymnodinialimonas phycosphaerae]MBY4892861.1 phospholipase [Gymnodinialimonas phycosphaerae]
MQDNQTAEDTPAITECQVCFNAEDAYPAFEQLCLSAHTEVIASFRVFDLTTKLRSDAARRIGQTWFDLVLHMLNQGVRFEITVTDFDPIVATDDHRRSWTSARQMAAANELSEGAALSFRIAMHPARVGFVPRQILSKKTTDTLKDSDADALTPGLEDLSPGDDLPLVPATHHQKLAVIDGQTLYIGGLDLNDRRYDTNDHERGSEQTWADIQAIVRGPVVAAAEHHLRSFLDVTDARMDAPPQAPGFLRTLSGKRPRNLLHIGPKPLVSEVEDAHLAEIERARGLIYLETQFFRHAPLAKALAAAAKRCDDIAVLLVLPAAPEDVAFNGNSSEDAQFGAEKQTKALRILADGLGERLAIAAPAKPEHAGETTPDAATISGAPLIYVHSKLSLFGTDAAIISSANLNGRSMHWDTEAGIHLTDPAMVKPLWPRVFDHWLGAHVPADPFGNPPAFIASINALLCKNAALAPPDRQHLLLPYDTDRHAELASDLPGVPDAMV